MADQPGQESVAEIRRSVKEMETRLDNRIKAMEARLDKRINDVEARLERPFRDAGRKFDAPVGPFDSRWDRMMKALVESAFRGLFQEWGVQINYVFQRSKGHLQDRTLELDLLLTEDERAAIIIEVRTRLDVEDVKLFLADVNEFLDFFPRYRTYRLYAGVAGLDIVEDADRYAYRQGLFVLSFSGEGVVQIKNDAAFRPKDFAASTPSLE